MKKDSFFISTIKYLCLAFFALLIVLPLWLLFVASLRDTTVLLQYPPKLWARDASLKNYVELLSKDFNYLRWFMNSMITVSLSTLGVLIVSSLAGYAFAKKTFWGKEVIFTVGLATMMIPTATVMLPLFFIVKALGLVNTYSSIFLPSLGSVVGVFLMRQFTSTIPSSLEESARIDGCSDFRVFANIIIPISLPSLAVLAIFNAMTQWNNLLWPLIIINKASLTTLPLAIAGMAQQFQFQTKWGITIAASILSFVPLLIMFVFAQEKFIAGMTSGALKG
jgi:multiple sugar transport system permease protein